MFRLDWDLVCELKNKQIGNFIYVSNLCKEFVRFHLSFTWVIKMHRIYICTQFTCLIHTAKMALLTGLEHSANRNILAIAPGRIKGVGFKPVISFRTQEILKRFITNAFPCIGLFASNLVLSQLKVLNLQFSLRDTIFFVIFS